MGYQKRVISLNDYEHRLMLHGLMAFRNSVLADGKPDEDVNALIMKVIDAPVKGRCDRAAR